MSEQPEDILFNFALGTPRIIPVTFVTRAEGTYTDDYGKGLRIKACQETVKNAAGSAISELTVAVDTALSQYGRDKAWNIKFVIHSTQNKNGIHKILADVSLRIGQNIQADLPSIDLSDYRERT